MYQPIEIDETIYWINKDANINDHLPCYTYHWNWRDKIHKYTDPINEGKQGALQVIVAQSKNKLEGLPVIELAWWNFSDLYVAELNRYQKNIEKAIELARKKFDNDGYSIAEYTVEEILELVDQLSLIEVDENFKILNYK